MIQEPWKQVVIAAATGILVGLGAGSVAEKDVGAETYSRDREAIMQRMERLEVTDRDTLAALREIQKSIRQIELSMAKDIK